MSPASAAQREKVSAQRCIACGAAPCDPAHLAARSRGGCDHPDCVVALCRCCHRAFDERRLDLLPYLEPHFRAELAHAVRHLSLLAVLERLSGQRWQPCENHDEWRTP